MSRGALIVLEGLDRSGKSTQAKKLVEYINTETTRKAVLLPFPERNDPFGKLIDQYLRREIDINEHALHLAFSANRWQMSDFIKKNIEDDVDVVCDRYAFSGVAYTMAKGFDSHWARQSDVGLPQPDVVLFFDVSPEVAMKRGGFGEERLETEELQRNVAIQMKSLKKDFWKDVDANQDMDNVQQQVVSIYNSIDRTQQLKSLTEI